MYGKKTPTGVRRGKILVHFWCIFLGIEKTYKIENQYLVGLFLRRERLQNLWNHRKSQNFNSRFNYFHHRKVFIICKNFTLVLY